MLGSEQEREELLEQFRQWLGETRRQLGEFAAGEAGDGEAGDGEAGDGEAGAAERAEPVGLYQLVEQLTALRHEVKLLTKASRGGEERSEATLLSMQAAIDEFRSASAQESGAAEREARPIVASLIDLDESLARGRRVIETVRHRALAEGAGELSELRRRFEELYRTQPWWRRWLCRPWHAALLDIHSGRTLDSQRALFDSLLEGYQLIQNRVERAFEEHGIRRLQCLGRPVDPHSMTVVEAVADLSRIPGTVAEEVRPGYSWNGKIVRFAEVKAVGRT